ncbi:MAG: FUSC family protein [Puniceicoccales bacterium]|nr:FUSC family protein [Puniceicoccales bacterium]
MNQPTILAVTSLLPEKLISVLRYAKDELAPFPGRGTMALNLIVPCAIVLLVSMGFRIPYVSLSIIVVFFVVQSNLTLTRIVGVVIFIVAIVGTGANLLLLKYTYDYHALRLLSASVMVFFGIYAMRVSKLGIVFYALSLEPLYVQSFADMTSMSQYLLEQCFWSTFAVLYPVVVVLLVNSYLFPSNAIQYLHDEVRRQLALISGRLAYLAGEVDNSEIKLNPKQLAQSAATLQKLSKFAAIGDKGPYAMKVYRQAVVAAVAHLLQITNSLSDTDRLNCPAGQSVTRHLGLQMQALGDSFFEGKTYSSHWAPIPDEQAIFNEHPHLLEIRRTLLALDSIGTSPEQEGKAESPKGALIVPDIRTNPNYVRYALKVTLSCIAAYIFYNAVAWPGIHTVMITCAVIAFPTLGATMHKGSLRIAGGVLGSIAALVINIFIFPHIDGIMGLLLAVMPVIAISAWIAAGSERIAYIGAQTVVTLSLALFEGFGPSNNLVEIRDRIIGILLGVLLMHFVFTYIWSESVSGDLRRKFTSQFHKLAALIRSSVSMKEAATHERQNQYLQQYLDCWSQVEECDRLLLNLRLERDYSENGKNQHLVRGAENMLARSRDILLAQDAFRTQANRFADGEGDLAKEIQTLRAQSADFCETYAKGIESGESQSSEARQDLDVTCRNLARLAHRQGADQYLLSSAQHLARSLAALPTWAQTNDDTVESQPLANASQNIS